MRQLYITTTNDCNLSCSYCFYNTGLYQKSLSNIDAKTFLNKIKQFPKYFDEAVFTGGEALLVKDIFQIASKFRKYGVKTRLITNGTLLTPSICKKIVSAFNSIAISLDSTDKIENNITRGKFHLVEEGINNILNIRSNDFEIELLQTITAINYKSIGKMIKYCEKQNIKHWLVPVDLCNANPNSLKRLSEIEKLEFQSNFTDWIKFRAGSDEKEQKTLLGYLKNINILIEGNKTIVPCKMGVENFMIDPEGNIYACFGRKDLFFGNIYKTKLSEIMERVQGKNLSSECVTLSCLCLTDF